MPLITRYNLREITGRDRLKLLVAEDNPVNQKLAVRMLERLGYRADVADNGREALEAVAQGEYAAILMDVQMPEMDGYEATRRIRRREAEEQRGRAEGRRTPVIAMTANAMEGDREKAIAAGMDDYVSKPINATDLSALLDRWLGLEETRVTNGETSDGPRGAGDGQDEAPPLDPEVLDGLRALDEGEDSSLLEELIDIYLEDAAPRIAAMRKAVGEDDPQTLQRAAHALKGSSANMGAHKLASIADRLQHLGSARQFPEAGGLVSALEREWARVRPALEDLKG